MLRKDSIRSVELLLNFYFMLSISNRITFRKKDPLPLVLPDKIKVRKKVCEGFAYYMHPMYGDKWGPRFFRQTRNSLELYKVLVGKRKLSLQHDTTHDLRMATTSESKIVNTVLVIMKCGEMFLIRTSTQEQSQIWLNRLSSRKSALSTTTHGNNDRDDDGGDGEDSRDSHVRENSCCLKGANPKRLQRGCREPGYDAGLLDPLADPRG